MRRNCKGSLPQSSFKQKGIVAILYIASLLGLIAICGLAVDVGVALSSYRQAQSAADAAALAAAHEKYLGRDDIVATAYGLSEAKSHGFESGQDDVVVTISMPPTSGYYTGSSDFVEATVSNESPMFFLSVIGFSGLNYTTRAVANSDFGGGDSCIYALGSEYIKAFHVSSGSSLYANCGVSVNSTNSEGLYVDGSSLTASEITTAGGTNSDNNLNCYDGSETEDCLTKNAAPTNDPLSHLTPPTVAYDDSSCASAESCESGVGCSGERDNNRYKPYTVEDSTETISPGLYCGGLFVKGTADVTMEPGTYIMRGGGLVVDGSDASLVGDGVFIYNTCESGCDGNEDDPLDYWPLDVKSGATIGLTSCSQSSQTSCEGLIDDDYQDLFWYADPEGPATDEPQNDPKNLIASTSDATLAGTFYAPNQLLNVASGSGLATYDVTNSVFVTKFMQVDSGTTFNVINDSSSSSSPYTRITLVE
ncbi:pilus assembly protein TadG-related protein [Vibrio maerlii]|uniref:pilus assembly protein TadG-related protein n=1 Tax=Vibrio maerlii TaxID=2231648 RepID=UPI000E3E8940|nr:pilus assembly protein TadG-related protein [Vibrio maerlii]